MKDTERLLAAFDTGELLRPSSEALNIVDLANAMASLADIGPVDLTAGARTLAELIGPTDHLVFVAVDGLGMDLVEGMGGDGFMSEHAVASLQTVFPSTTASAFTSLATGEWPSRHAALGWYTYVPKADAVAKIVPFVRASDEVPLTKLGLTAEDVFPLPSLVARLGRDSLSLLPEHVADSVFSQYVSGGTARRGYKSLASAVDAIAARVESSARPTYTYLYTANVDYTGHEYGYSDPRTRATADQVDRELGRLATRTAGRARIVVTADHGGLDASQGQQHLIRPTDELGKLLAKEPSGDSRVVYFDVREGMEEEFQELFGERFGNRFMLIGRQDAERLELFGPGPLSDASRRRLGSLIALSTGADVLYYARTTEQSKKVVGHHSGLSPVEMRVPLIVA